MSDEYLGRDEVENFIKQYSKELTRKVVGGIHDKRRLYVESNSHRIVFGDSCIGEIDEGGAVSFRYDANDLNYTLNVWKIRGELKRSKPQIKIADSMDMENVRVISDNLEQLTALTIEFGGH